MDTRTKSTVPQLPVPHLLYFEPGELTLISGRHTSALEPGFREMMSQKLLPAILWHHPGVDAKQVDIVHLHSPANTPKYWGVVLEVLYRIKGTRNSYRHVFRFMVNGDQCGRLFTQLRRRIAK